MAKLATVSFTGTSGATYEFDVYPWDTDFNAVGAVYFVTKRSHNAQNGYSHSGVYVGQTGDLSERFNSHHQPECLKRNGVHCICVYREGTEGRRREIEADLIANYQPPCNG
jgi:hypothetical protein